MRNWIALVSVLALLAGCVYLFFALFERYQTTEDIGWGPEAIRNPYLGAERFLERAGVATDTIDSLYDEAAIAGIDTVFVEDSRNVLSERRLSLLTDWVAEGGNLIVAAHYPFADDGGDLLLDSFDISLRSADCACNKQAAQTPTVDTEDPSPLSDIESDTRAEKPAPARSLSEALREYNRMLREEGEGKAEGKTEGDAESARQQYEAGVDPAQLTHLEFSGTPERLRVHFNASWVLHHPYFDLDGEQRRDYAGLRPFYWAGNEGGVTFLQMEVGDGLVSVMARPDIWTSREIAFFDHAYLLHVLASGGDTLRLLVGSHMPSLFTLIWKHGRELVIAFACWLFAWLLYRGRRFLPPVPLTVTVRRSLAEHIQAVANFLWRSRCADVLLQPLREEIEFQAQLNVSGYGAMTLQDKYRALAGRSGLAAEAVYRAMTEQNPADEERFTEITQLLQTIRATI